MDPESYYLPQVQQLPAVLTTAEAQAFLRLPDDFLRMWLNNGSKLAPAIPHFKYGQKIVFPTEAVLAWLAEYHGYGGTMKHPSMRPKTKRKGPTRKP